MELTDESLLAQILCCREVLFPLEEGESLVDQRKDVHSTALLADNLLLHLNCRLELLNRLLVLLLIKEQLAVVVVNVTLVTKVLDAAAESGHGRGNGTHLVLGNTELDVREDELGIEVDGLLVVGSGQGEFGKNEVELSAVVEDVGVVGVVLNGKLEVMGGLVALG